LLTIFITKKILNFLFIKGDQDDLKDNLALSIFSGSIIIGVLMLVNSSILPAVDTLRVMVLANEVITFNMVGLSFLYFLLFFTISIFFSIVILFLTLKVFFKATGWVEEMKEMRNKNVAVAIVVAAVGIGISLFVRPALNRFISSLIHYEKFESIGNESIPEEDEPGGMIIPLEQVEPK
jgi:uncharacterized membrane protein YjfL (UPF0719 family)